MKNILTSTRFILFTTMLTLVFLASKAFSSFFAIKDNIDYSSNVRVSSHLVDNIYANQKQQDVIYASRNQMKNIQDQIQGEVQGEIQSKLLAKHSNQISNSIESQDQFQNQLQHQSQKTTYLNDLKKREAQVSSKNLGENLYKMHNKENVKTIIKNDKIHHKDQLLILNEEEKGFRVVESKQDVIDNSLIQAQKNKLEEEKKSLNKIKQDIETIKLYNDRAEKERIAKLVKIYESMRPDKAAMIFNNLDDKILLNIIDKMKPAKIAAIMNNMSPAKAKVVSEMLSKISLAD